MISAQIENTDHLFTVFCAVDKYIRPKFLHSLGRHTMNEPAVDFLQFKNILQHFRSREPSVYCRAWFLDCSEKLSIASSSWPKQQAIKGDACEEHSSNIQLVDSAFKNGKISRWENG